MDSRFFKTQCFIDNNWRDADNGETISVNNPATGAKLGTAPKMGRAETAEAISAAANAFPEWRAISAAARGDYAYAIYECLMDNKAELGRLLTLEMGKPLAEAEGEVAYAASFFKWFAGEAIRIYGDVIPSPWTDKRVIVTKEPVGVVGAITPWNFPTAMIARKAGAALAAGCPIVIKPASATPFSALAYGVIAEDVGLPNGVLNIITGSASAIADEMCENSALRKITFTGSTQIGKQLSAKALSHMKRISMELGGNAPFIVFDDADIDKAVDGAIGSKFRNGGQTCVCANRIYVADAIYDQFTDKLAARVKELNVGDGLQGDVDIGPMINEDGVKKVEEQIADAVAKGARIVVGGARHANSGTYFEPTLLAGVTQTMDVAHEETFGPVAPIFRFETEEEVITLANDTEYGLASYFYTKDLGRTWRVMEALEYGMVGVNEGVISTPVAPFGGVKDSGVGREGSKYGVDEYINIKMAVIGGLE